MSWQIFISIQLVLVAFATIITRLLARDKKIAKAGLVITAAWFAILYAIGLVALPHMGPVDTSAFSSHWLQFVGGGIAFSLMNVMIFYSMVYLEAAIGSIIGTVSAIFTVFGASLILHENLNHLQILGTWLLLISVVYGMLSTRHAKNRQVHRNLAIGVLLSLVASVFYALASLNEKSLLNQISPGTYVLYGWGTQTVAAICLALLVQPKQLKVLLKPNVAGWTVVLGVLRAISGYSFIQSLVKSNNVGLMTVVANFKLILIILLGAWLLQERNKMKQKFIAAAGASVALAMLFWH